MNNNDDDDAESCATVTSEQRRSMPPFTTTSPANIERRRPLSRRHQRTSIPLGHRRTLRRCPQFATTTTTGECRDDGLGSPPSLPTVEANWPVPPAPPNVARRGTPPLLVSPLTTTTDHRCGTGGQIRQHRRVSDIDERQAPPPPIHHQRRTTGPTGPPRPSFTTTNPTNDIERHGPPPTSAPPPAAESIRSLLPTTTSTTAVSPCPGQPHLSLVTSPSSPTPISSFRPSGFSSY
jgi:hypothetical protein